MKFYTKCMVLIVALAIVFFGGFSQEVKYPKKFEGYLFAYFEGSGPGEAQEQLRFAASVDGTNWSALNHNNPVIKSDTIANSGGIRDPHILRKEDASGFFITATDMNTHKNGWARNTGIVMLKSSDLGCWSHSAVDLAKEYPATFAKVNGYGRHKRFMTRLQKNTWCILPSGLRIMKSLIFIAPMPTRTSQVLKKSQL